MINGLIARHHCRHVRSGKKNELSLTSWPIKVVLIHPNPYNNVEVSALTLGLTILCAEVMTSNCAEEMIVTFVLGSMPRFKIVLIQGTCKKISVDTFQVTQTT